MRGEERRKLGRRLTKLFLDDFEYLLLVKFFGESLDSRQSLTTITLYHGPDQSRLPDAKGNVNSLYSDRTTEEQRTLNPDVDVVLRLFSLPGIFVGFGEGVYTFNNSQSPS